MNWSRSLFCRSSKIKRANTAVEVVEMSNAEFIPVVLDFVEKGKTATLPLRGFSMRPFLEDRRDKALLVKPDGISVGDAVLAEISERHYVLHRVWKIDGDNVTLMGDGNLTPEHCQLSDIRAKAIAFYRKGRSVADSTYGRKWKIYSWIWVRLFPVRRWILAFYRRLPGVTFA